MPRCDQLQFSHLNVREGCAEAALGGCLNMISFSSAISACEKGVQWHRLVVPRSGSAAAASGGASM
eukprot:12430100-Karenia_brevis.AAC.1